MSQERRHFSRIQFLAPAQLSTVDERWTVQVLDLSLQGALVQLPADVSIAQGEPCLLALPLGEHRLRLAAELAHQNGPQAGLQIRAIDLESITHLRRLVEMNLGSSKLLERELRALAAA